MLLPSEVFRILADLGSLKAADSAAALAAATASWEEISAWSRHRVATSEITREGWGTTASSRTLRSRYDADARLGMCMLFRRVRFEASGGAMGAGGAIGGALRCAMAERRCEDLSGRIAAHGLEQLVAVVLRRRAAW